MRPAFGEHFSGLLPQRKPKSLGSHLGRDECWSADLVEPASLPWGFNGSVVVVAADPGERVAWGEAVEDGECGEGGSGAADAAAAGDFNAFAAACAVMGVVEGVEGVVAVGGDPEVRPADMSVRPGRERSVGQDQGEVGGAGEIAQAPAPDLGSAWQGDQPGVVSPGGGGHCLVGV
jgi:hypothetical protein